MNELIKKLEFFKTKGNSLVYYLENESYFVSDQIPNFHYIKNGNEISFYKETEKEIPSLKINLDNIESVTDITKNYVIKISFNNSTSIMLEID